MNDVYKLHSLLIKTGLQDDAASLRRLLLSCAAAASASSAPESLPHARALFAGISSPDVVAYNTIIRSHAHSSPLHSLSFFARMLRRGVSPDNFTFPFVLKACSHLREMGHGLHALIAKLGLGSDVYVQNALISAYGCTNAVESARKVFDEMPERDLVSWSSLIGCYANNGFGYDALACFREMQLVESFEPDRVTLLSVISAISSLGALELGRWVDCYVRRIGLSWKISVGTALIDMYSRCGSVIESMRVFNEMPERNVLTWTVAINGLAVHGRSAEALKLFHDMKESGMQPDSITFSAVLVACSHAGLVKEGRGIFESIKKEYGMEPTLEHYGCMVDIFGRAGMVEQAYEFVEKMPIRPNSVVWRTLLGACVNHNHLGLAEKARGRIHELDPHHDGDYVLLSNAYGGVGKWNRKAQMRILMKDRRISKRPGYSLINADQEIHEFVSGENSHPEWENIRDSLTLIIDRLKLRGYTPQTSNVLHDIEEEEKESNLSYHSEKLAIAFALLHLENGRTIRVMKNIRICHDCHSFMKHVSDVFQREIVVRDQNRFHHFSKGSCSCRDFW
ncbi:hypothetical protein BT93_G1400 [Corymbia citriodora subsp. variegata]|nr:hypothetical protein BT93_G1400 [Corymbia citriodora subsp. variegata]